MPTRSVTGPGAATQGEGPQPLRARRDPLEDTRSQGCLGPRAPRSGVRHRSRLGWMVASYGWRVLAIPVLVVLTVLAVLDTIRYSPTPTSTTAAAGAAGGLRSHNAGSAGPPISGPVADGSFDPSTAAGTLPEGGLFPTTGAGTWHVVPGTTPQVGVGTTSVNTYTVEVENGMDTTAFGGDEDVASVVEHTLAAPQGWTHDGRFAFRRIDSGTPTVRISLTSQATVRPDTECGYQVPMETSCFNATTHRVVLNAARWVRGAVGARRTVLSGRRRFLPALHDQPRSGARHRVRPPAVPGRRCPRTGDDAANVRYRQQPSRPPRPGRGGALERAHLPAQPVAVPAEIGTDPRPTLEVLDIDGPLQCHHQQHRPCDRAHARAVG